MNWLRLITWVSCVWAIGCAIAGTIILHRARTHLRSVTEMNDRCEEALERVDPIRERYEATARAVVQFDHDMQHAFTIPPPYTAIACLNAIGAFQAALELVHQLYPIPEETQ